MTKKSLADILNSVWYPSGTLVVAGVNDSRRGYFVCNCASENLTIPEAQTLAKYLATSHNTLLAMAQKDK